MKVKEIPLIAFSTILIVVVWLIYNWTDTDYEKRFRQNSEEFAKNRIYFEKLIHNYRKFPTIRTLNCAVHNVEKDVSLGAYQCFGSHHGRRSNCQQDGGARHWFDEAVLLQLCRFGVYAYGKIL